MQNCIIIFNYRLALTSACWLELLSTYETISDMQRQRINLRLHAFLLHGKKKNVAISR